MADEEVVLTIRGKNLSTPEVQAAVREFLGLQGAADKVTQSAHKIPAAFRDVQTSAKGLYVDISNVNVLVRQFAGDDTRRRAEELAAAVKKVGGAAQLTAADQRMLNRELQTYLAQEKELGRPVPPHLQQLALQAKLLAPALADVSKQAKTLVPPADASAKWTQLTGSINGVAGAFGVTLGAGAVIAFGKHVFDAADQVGTLATKMGVSTDAAQRFQYAARQSGADIEDVSQAIAHLNAGVGEGENSPTVKALQGIGLEISVIRSLNPEQLFRKTIDTISGMTDPFQQASAAADVFGEKVGAKLLPMIREGTLKVADGVHVMSKETIAALKDAKQEWANFFDWLTIESGEALAEVMRTQGNIAALLAGELGKIKVSKEPESLSFSDIFNPVFGGGRKLADRFVFGPLGQRGAAVDDAMASMPGVSGALRAPGADAAAIEKQRREMAQAQIKDATAYSVALALAKKELAGLSSETRTQIAAGLSMGESTKEISERLKVTEAAVGMYRDRMQESAAATKRAADETRRLTDEATRLAQAYQAFERQKLTGISDEERQRRQMNQFFEETFLDERGLLSKFQAMDAIVKRRNQYNGLPYQNVLEGYTKPGPGLVNFTPMDRLGGFQQEMLAVSHLFDGPKQKAASDGLGDLLQDGFSEAMHDLPTTVLRAFRGGGDVGKSIGSLLGGQIMTGLTGTAKDGVFEKGLGKMLQGSFLGDKVGGLVASFLPGLGSLAAPLITGAISGVGRLTGHNATKGGREDLAKQLGFDRLPELLADLDSLGEKGQKLAHTARNVIGRNDEAANKKWMADVLKFYDGVEGGADKAARAAAEAFKKQQQLLSDQAEATEFLNTTLQKYGFTIDELGPKWKNQRLAEEATLLLREYTALTASGVANETVQRKMGRGIFDFLQTAKRTGAEVPLEFKKIAEEAIRLGTAVGENGERLEDLNGITWAETFSQSIDRVVSKLDELIRKITGDLGRAVDEAATGLEDVAAGPSGESVWERARRLNGSRAESGSEGGDMWHPTPQPVGMANGGLVTGPKLLFVEPGRQEIIGDQRFMARALAPLMSHPSGSRDGGGADVGAIQRAFESALRTHASGSRSGAGVVNINITIDKETAADSANLRANAMKIGTAIATAMRTSGTLRTAHREALGLPVGPGF